MIVDYFNRTVIIQRKTAVSNGFGGYIDTWPNYLTINGLIDKLSGNEKQIAAQYADSATHTLFAEAGSDIASNDRIKCDGKIYRILDIDNPMNMNHHLEILLAYEGVDQ